MAVSSSSYNRYHVNHIKSPISRPETLVIQARSISTTLIDSIIPCLPEAQVPGRTTSMRKSLEVRMLMSDNEAGQ
jgi:hypothetical protein